MVICRASKRAEQQGKILFIDAVKEVTRERAQSFLKAEHQAKILEVYRQFSDQPGFAALATKEEVLAKEGNLSIPRYVRSVGRSDNKNGEQSLKKAWTAFEAEGRGFWQQMEELVEMLDGLTAREVEHD